MSATGVPAAAAEFALTNGSVPHSGAVGLFLGLPRLSGGGGTDLGELGAAVGGLLSFVTGVATAAAVPVVGAGVALGLAFALNLARGSCLRDALDRRLVARRGKAPADSLGHLTLSVALVMSFCFFLAVGGVGVVVVAEAALNVADSLTSFVDDVRRTGLSLIDFVLWMERKFVEFDTQTLNEDGTEAGELLQTAFQTLIDYVPPRLPDVDAARDAVEDLMSNIRALIKTASGFVDVYFGAMVGFALLTSLALSVVLCNGMFTRRRTCCTWLIHAFVLFLPLAFSWALFVVATGAGIAVADTCRMVGEYRAFITTGVAGNTTENLLLDAGLVCPTQAEAEQQIADLEAAADSILGNPLAAETTRLILDTPSTAVSESAQWAVGEVSEYANCNILLRLSGRLESLVCGARLTSLISGVRYLWVSKLMISLVMTLIYCASVIGLPVMWAATVWALPPKHDSFLEHLASASQPDEEKATAKTGGEGGESGEEDVADAAAGDIEAVVGE